MNHTTEPDSEAEPRSGPGPPSGGGLRPAPAARPIRTWTLRTHLGVMALLVMLPMGAIAGVAIHSVVKEYQHAYQARLRATARLLGIAFDTDIQMRKVAIMAIADSPLLDRLGSLEFYEYAKQIGAELGTWVRIDTPDRPMLNTRVPYGGVLPQRLRAWEPARIAHFNVTNILHISSNGTPFVAVDGPVTRDGQVIASIAIPFSYQQLGQRLAQGSFTGDGVLCLLDGDGVVIARNLEQERYVGHRAPDWVAAAAALPGQSIVFGRLLDGTDVIIATAHPSEAPDWTVTVAQPVAGYYHEWFRPLLVVGGGALVLLIALLVLLDRYALWLVRPLTMLTQNAKIVARGNREQLPVAHRASRVAEFETLLVSLNGAAQVMDGRAEAIRLAFATARRERNLLHSVVNGTSDPTCVKTADGRIVLANAATLALHGQNATDFIGKIRYDSGLTKTADDCRAEDRRVVESGAPIRIERLHEVGGEQRTYVGTKSPWRNAAGAVLGIVVIIHDITDWKRSENRLRDLQAELIRTGRLSAMGALADGLAHELNQPLAAITNFLGAARQLIPPPASPPAADGAAGKPMPLTVARGAIEDACGQVMRAGEIVSRLRDFIGQGVTAMRVETIGDLIADACALALPPDTRDRVVLHVSIEADLSPVFADRLQIQQVLVNLVLNAVQSMANSARRVVTITAARDAVGDTCIRVADTGGGIPASMLSKVFEPFVTTRPDGLGMGLAIARMIVAAHGGTLGASNNEDGGATLTLVLPAVLSMEVADA